MFPLAATDTETTGLRMGARLCELAANLFDENGAVIDRFEMLINPGMPIPVDSNNIHHITDEMVEDAPSAGIALAAFFDWLPAEAHLVIHNAPYDVGILNYELQRYARIAPEPRVIDTLAIARERGGKRGNDLPALAKKYSLTSDGSPHRAGYDADITRQFFMVCHQAKPITKAWAGTWRSYCTYEFLADNELPSDLAMLPDLVAAGAPLAFKYEDAEGKKTKRTITPYGWAVKDGSLYFSGNCHLRSAETGKIEIRDFRADRVQQVFA